MFSLFYFVGLGSLAGVVSGLRAVPLMFAGVYEDFAGIWLPEWIFALIPYVVIRALTIGRFVRPTWWSFCLAGLVTFPFLHLYGNVLIKQWDTPMNYNIAAHLLSGMSAIAVELLTLVCVGWLFGQRRAAEPSVHA